MDAKLVSEKNVVAGKWAIVFLDTPDRLGSAYHDLTPDGLPLAKVFVKSVLEEGQLVSVAASHELAEMLADPAINLYASGAESGVVYAYEIVDPVEESTFTINGIHMSNFVYPSYFEKSHEPGSVQFDFMQRVKKPFEILEGGYLTISKDGKQSNLFGSTAKAKRFALEDRRGHRSEARKTGRLQRSAASVSADR